MDEESDVRIIGTYRPSRVFDWAADAEWGRFPPAREKLVNLVDWPWERTVLAGMDTARR